MAVQSIAREVAVAGAHGGTLLTRLLVWHGVEFVFGLPGGQTYALYDGIAQFGDRIRHVLVRDERSGAYAADAYARLTGKVGVCDATVGPGAAKLPSGLAEAMGVSIPVIAIVSDLPANLELHRQRGGVSQALDQVSLLRPVTKWVGHVPDQASLPGLVRQAFREATTGRPGPTALIVPQDVLDAELGEDGLALLDAEPLGSDARFGHYPAFRPAPDPQDLADAVVSLTGARRPVIIAGGGVHISQAADDLVGLAEVLDAPIATTLSGKGVIAEDHELSVGVLGSMGVPAAAAVVDAADTVLLVGMKSGSGPTYNWTRPRQHQTVVQLDIDPTELGRAFPIAAALNCDARAGLAALRVALPTLAPKPEWREQIAAQQRDWLAERDLARSRNEVPIWPQRVMGELEAALGEHDVVLCDASLASGWGAVFIEQRLPGRRVLLPRGQAGLGWAVPAAIGAATADRSRRTVAIVGDGALGYCVGEFATISEQRLPVTVIVLNNSSLGWIRWYSRIKFDRGWEQPDFDDVDFASVARGYGWDATRVTEPSEIAMSLANAFGAEGPSLVEFVTETWQTPVVGHRTALEQGRGTGYGG